MKKFYNFMTRFWHSKIACFRSVFGSLHFPGLSRFFLSQLLVKGLTLSIG